MDASTYDKAMQWALYGMFIVVSETDDSWTRLVVDGHGWMNNIHARYFRAGYFFAKRNML